MNTETPGKQTSEYRMTQVTLVVNTIISLLVVYGIITAEEAPLWATLLLSAGALALPMVTTLAVKTYNQGRTDIKIASILENGGPGASIVRPEASEETMPEPEEVQSRRNIFQPSE